MEYTNFAALKLADGLMMLIGLAVPVLLAAGLLFYWWRNFRHRKKDRPIWYALYFLLLAGILYYVAFVY